MTPTPRASDPFRRLIPACFFVSGAAGLILEVVWSKYLSLLLGNSIHGVATAVAAFLGGLGLGAVLAGRRAPRLGNPLAGYALLELVVGGLALLSPLAFPAAHPLLAALYRALGGPTPAFHAVRLLILFAAMLVPTVAMGATLPLIVEDAVRRWPAASGGAVARLYAVNTGGAVAGTLAAGFALIPALGLSRAAIVAALLDLAVAAALAATRLPAPVPAARPAAAVARGPSGRAGFGRLLLPAVAVSGLVAILYQVAWTRLLTIPFGGTVYAFSAILAVYLLGLALGSAAAAPLIRRTRSPAVLFGTLQAGLAASVALGLHALPSIPYWQASLIDAAGRSVPRLIAGDTGIAAVVLLLPTLLLGALFPAAVALWARGGGEARATGAVYAANTAGSIVGAIGTALLLMPAFGAPAVILGGAAVNAALAVLALLGSESPAPVRRLSGGFVLAGALAFGLFARPTWSHDRMSLGLMRLLQPYWNGGEAVVRWVIDSVGTPTDPGRITFYREGAAASVAVIEAEGRTTLVINGKADATIGLWSDMRTQVLLGELPFLAAPAARDLFVIGYGSGVTTGSVLRHPVREVCTVEIEPAVIEAAPHFRSAAGEPLSDPRHRLVLEDANLVLRSESRPWDVIVSEPSNMWIAGMGDLFSEDFYRIAAARLRPGGLLCQWLHGYQLSRPAMDVVMRTLAHHFPHGQIFCGSVDEDLIVLASPRDEVPLDPGSWERAFAAPAVAADLARVDIRGPADLLRFYRGRLERVAAAAGAGPLNTDDNGWIEHRAPLDLLGGNGVGAYLRWDDATAGDLVQSLRGSPDRAAALLGEAAVRASAAGDSAAAVGLRGARARLRR